MRDSVDGVLGVDPDALRAAVPDLTDVADGLATTLSRLRGALAEAGPCWGHDEPGAAFASGYLAGGEQAERAFAELGDAIETIGGRLTEVADRSEATDQLARARFR
jgi:uncharacterized protein YukE